MLLLALHTNRSSWYSMGSRYSRACDKVDDHLYRGSVYFNALVKLSGAQAKYVTYCQCL